MKLKYLLIPAVTLPAVLAFAGMASAHNALITASCVNSKPSGTFTTTQYDGGSFTVYTDAVQVDTGTFTTGTSKTYNLGSPTSAHTFRVVIDAPGTAYDHDQTINVKACQETPPSTTTTTLPASTTTAPPASTTTTSTSAPASTTTPPATSQPAPDTTAPSATTSPPATSTSSEPSSTTVTNPPGSSTTDCNLPPSPAQCINPRHEIVATCDKFLTDGDGWSDQMHADIQIGAEHLPTDMFAWAVTRDSSALGTNGYTYRVTVTDAAAGAYDSGLITVPACGKVVVVTPPVSTPTELPSTGFFIDLLLAVAAVFIITGLVIRYASRRTHL